MTNKGSAYLDCKIKVIGIDLVNRRSYFVIPHHHVFQYISIPIFKIYELTGGAHIPWSLQNQYYPT